MTPTRVASTAAIETTSRAKDTRVTMPMMIMITTAAGRVTTKARATAKVTRAMMITKVEESMAAKWAWAPRVERAMIIMMITMIIKATIKEASGAKMVSKEA